ncbi:hypothetical protein Tco_1029855 [Tanacetum coccineum]|uniref:Uncharacterized protein n=1 Tax=Tanacetum coccineum TaxID=301880 RepID=A0ABQ5G4Q7_9ASTR
MHSALPTTGTNMPLRPGLILARTMLPIIEDWDTDSDNDSEVPKESSKDAVADDAGKKTNKESANEGERNGQEKEGGALNKEDDQNVQDFRAALDNLLIFHRSFSFLRFEDTVSYSGAYDDGMMGRVTPKKKALINEELLPPVARIKDNQVYKVERPDMVLYSAPRALFQVTPKVSHLDAVRYLHGEDFAAPIDSHSTPIHTQPSSSKPQKKKFRRKQRKDSGPTKPIPDEATNEEHVATPSCDPPQSGKKIADLDVEAEELVAIDPVTTAGEVVTTDNVEVTTANAPTTTIE